MCRYHNQLNNGDLKDILTADGWWPEDDCRWFSYQEQKGC